MQMPRILNAATVDGLNGRTVALRVAAQRPSCEPIAAPRMLKVSDFDKDTATAEFRRCFGLDTLEILRAVFFIVTSATQRMPVFGIAATGELPALWSG